MQKLVSIYLNSHAYPTSNVSSSRGVHHGLVEDYLESDLKDGWKIKEITTMSSGHEDEVSGWLFVVLERQEID